MSLGAAGRELRKQILADVSEQIELDARDLRYLADAARAADRAADLAAAIERDGVVLDGKQGPRVHPACSELRQTEAAVAKLLGLIDLDVETVGSQSATSRAARAASRKRWAQAGQSRRAETRSA